LKQNFNEELHDFVLKPIINGSIHMVMLT